MEIKTSELRAKFIEFFKQKSHTFVPGSSTIPACDQTILFTIAGMTQFKAVLTGKETRPYKRATNSQKCIRAGDLDDVGHDGRHLTMFEMLGSWSFGDYFKKNAIEWAYELVRDVIKLDLSRLWVTVHTSDDEAYQIWKNVGIPEERIRRLGDDTNFWAMGPTGPCGPCSELYIDQGEEVGRCGDSCFNCTKGPGCDCDRYLEFWNLVFMQYERKEDGMLVELPMKSVDTGAGLERFVALINGKTSVFEIDIFRNLKVAIANLAGVDTSTPFSREVNDGLNVIADHIRTLTFPLADGAYFSNEGRGYLLRRVLRRAVRYAHKLNPDIAKKESFLAELVPVVVQEMGEFYPEIRENQKRITDAIRTEEARFKSSLEKGLEKFHGYVEAQKAQGARRLTGEQVFTLHDTFGFPSDLTRILCQEIGFVADLADYERHMMLQKEKSRSDAKFYKFDQDDSPWIVLNCGGDAEERRFVGYGIWESNARVNGVESAEIPIKKSQIRRVRQLQNHLFELVLAETPFYAESGGQSADTGWMRFESDEVKNEFEVVDVRKTPGAIVHLLKSSELSNPERERLSDAEMQCVFGGCVHAFIDTGARAATARNHTATHLLQKALQVVLGEQVRQAGSMVSPELLRFDFTFGRGITAEEISRVEAIVNREIMANRSIKTHVDVEISEAKRMGAMAIFDEKYDDKVRVVEVPGYSMELCGGTHVPATGNIGLLRIMSEGSVTAGVRRIEAVTGANYIQVVNELRAQVHAAATEAGCADSDLVQRVRILREENKLQEKSVAALQSRLVNAQIVELIGTAVEPVPGVKVVAAVRDGIDIKELELLLDRTKERCGGVVVLGTAVDGKAVVMAGVAADVVKKFKGISAGAIVKSVCELVDGKGGGKPEFARGGGASPEKLPSAFEQIATIVARIAGA